jgi:hypothetical protein
MPTADATPVRRPQTGLAHRLVWRAHRVSLGWMVKGPLSLWHITEKTKRRAFGRDVRAHATVDLPAEHLRHKGWAAITELADPVLLEALRQEASARVTRADELARTQSLTHKSFWVRLLDEDLVDGCFASDNLFVRFAMQSGIVDLVTRYLGELPMLVDVLLTLSRDSEAELAYSQLWHKDYDDTRTLKVFVYLTDVRDRRDGPFTFLPKGASRRIGMTLRSHLADDRVFARVERSEIREMYGAALTTFICETSQCLHMGSRVARGHSRLMYTATYIPAPIAYPGYVPKFRAAHELEERERLLLGL